jgi:hypothetical protein
MNKAHKMQSKYHRVHTAHRSSSSGLFCAAAVNTAENIYSDSTYFGAGVLILELLLPAPTNVMSENFYLAVSTPPRI